MSNECEHEWVFAQTLWESTTNPSSATGIYTDPTEYAYYYCDKCLITVKRAVNVEVTT